MRMPKTHTLHAIGADVIDSLEREGWTEQRLLRFLRPSNACWQPQDLLPDPSSPDFYDQVCVCV